MRDGSTAAGTGSTTSATSCSSPRASGAAAGHDPTSRVERLTAAGLMRPAGLAAVAAAVADGSGTALDAVEDLIEPDEPAAALDAVPAARESWDGFSPSARKGILQWIATAKRRPVPNGSPRPCAWRPRKEGEPVRWRPRPAQAGATPRISRSLVSMACSPSLTRVAPIPMKLPSLAASASLSGVDQPLPEGTGLLRGRLRREDLVHLPELLDDLIAGRGALEVHLLHDVVALLLLGQRVLRDGDQELLVARRRPRRPQRGDALLTSRSARRVRERDREPGQGPARRSAAHSSSV